MPNDVTARSSVMGVDGKPINDSIRGSSSLGFGSSLGRNSAFGADSRT